MKILFVGDIVGRIGREAVRQFVPKLIRREKIDFVIANGENLAHGKGITERTARSVLTAGVDLLTSGNHIFAKKGFDVVLSTLPVLRPANFPEAPGKGYEIFEVGARKLLVINLMGRGFMREVLDCPFKSLEKILEENKGKFDKVVVDFHAEATGESRAFGLFADGKVDAVFGTHRHIQTNDAQILPKGTFYITDVGMVGAYPSVLGVEAEEVIRSYLTGVPFRHEIPEEGKAEFGAVIVNLSSRPPSFRVLREFVSI